MRHNIILQSIILVLVLCGATLADTYSWVAGDGSFQRAGNWDPNAVPGTTDRAYFTNGPSYEVTFSASDSTDQNWIGGDGTVNLNIGDGQTYDVTRMYIHAETAGGAAGLVVTSGVLNCSNRLYLNAPWAIEGPAGLGSASLLVSGTNTIFRYGDLNTLGGYPFSLTVSDGAIFEPESGKISERFDMRCSNLTNNLVLVDGGTIQHPNALTICNIGVRSSPTDLTGYLIVTNGGTFNTGIMTHGFFVGRGAPAEVHVSGSNSLCKADLGNNLEIGSSYGSNILLPPNGDKPSSGTLIVSDGGRFWDPQNSRDFWIGRWTNSVGQVTATGTGSLVDLPNKANGEIYIGYWGTGTVTVADGGAFVAPNATAIVNENGTIEVKYGGAAVSLDTLTLTNAATLKFIADADGCGTIYVDGTLDNVDAAGLLKVDVRNYDFATYGSDLVLVEYGTLSNPFDSGNITIQANYGTSLDQSTGNKIVLTVSGPVGTAIIVQ